MRLHLGSPATIAFLAPPEQGRTNAALMFPRAPSANLMRMALVGKPMAWEKSTQMRVLLLPCKEFSHAHAHCACSCRLQRALQVIGRAPIWVSVF